MLKQFWIGLVFLLAIVAVGGLEGAGIITMSNAVETSYESQTSNEHGVKVTVIPRILSYEAKIWGFEVVLETHTRNLSDDLSKSSRLIADGRRYAPLGWNGTPPGGHHRKGSLRFKPIAPPPASVELQIRLAGEDAPRSFKWLLKGAGNGS